VGREDRPSRVTLRTIDVTTQRVRRALTVRMEGRAVRLHSLAHALILLLIFLGTAPVHAAGSPGVIFHAAISATWVRPEFAPARRPAGRPSGDGRGQESADF
jgi:hypothetical protein